MDVKLSVVVPVYRQDHNLEKTLLNLKEVVTGLSGVSVTLLNNQREVGGAQSLMQRHALDFRYIENEQTLPISDNWNKCIEVADGEWVHILHEDDTVEPTFYRRFLEAVAEEVEFGAYVARHSYINGEDLSIGVGLLVAKHAGVFSEMARWQAYRNVIQPPCIIVKKDVYQQVGGFRTDLRYTLDWEMWYRICINTPVWYEPLTLVNYRIHESQLTSNEKESGNSARDVIKGYRVIASYCAEQHRRLALNHAEHHILATAKQYFRLRQIACARRQLWILVRWRPQSIFYSDVLRMMIWYFLGRVKGLLGKK